MRLNTAAEGKRAETHEGGRADAHQKPALELERAVATCLLWESTFYEQGDDIATRIAALCKLVPVEDIAVLAIKARNEYKLRHVPLFLCVQLIALGSGREDGLVSSTIGTVVQRPDEMGELITLYRKNGRKPLAKQLRKGLQIAFGKFSEYQMSKWNRDAAIKIRDVMRMIHPKPAPGREELYKAIAAKTLAPADTWEVALSSGADKKATWERLLSERKLGYIALLMNLRNIEKAKVDDRLLVETALLSGAKGSKALPFRFVSAAKHAPSYAQALSEAMIAALSDAPPLEGSTLLVVDVSGSMDATISGKSELMRLEAAGALAILLREVCISCRVFTFSDDLVEVQNFRGLPMLKGIADSQPHRSTMLAASLAKLKAEVPNADRLIVVTDEQSHDGTLASWAGRGYLCNVAPYKPGLELSGGWTRISGWSERIIDYIRADERLAS